MDWGAVVEGISRDLGEFAGGDPVGWFMLVGFFGLPIAVVVATIRTSRRALWFPAVLWLVPVCTVVLYYGTGWWADPGMQGIVILALPVMLGWIALAVIARPRAVASAVS